VSGPPPVRALVIDDDPVVLLATRHVLVHRGSMDVTTATGPWEALKLVETAGFDVVVTDVQMPQMTGLELLDRLQLILPGLPVVVVTADVGVDNALQVVRSRASGFLFKPLDPDRLVQMVSDLVHHPTQLPAAPRRRLWRANR